MTGLVPVLNAVEWTLTGISALFLVGRLYVKIMHNRVVWWDDYLLLLSWIMLAAGVSITTYATTMRFGAPLTDSSNITSLNLLIIITLPFTLLSSALSKTSFAMTLLRFTSGSLRTLLRLLTVTLNFMIGFNIILPFASCNPPSKTWDTDARGSCWDATATIKYQISTAAFGAGTNLILVLVPFTVLCKICLSSQEKWGIAAATALGLLGTSAGVIRSINIPLGLDFRRNDYTVEAGKLSIWTVAEISCVIMASSIPSLRVFGRRMVLSSTITSPMNSPRAYEPYRPFSHIRKSETDGIFKRTLKTALSRKSNSAESSRGIRADSNTSKVGARNSETTRTIHPSSPVTNEYEKQSPLGTSAPHNSWSWVLRGGRGTLLLPDKETLHVDGGNIVPSPMTMAHVRNSSSSKSSSEISKAMAKNDLVVVNRTSTGIPPTPWSEMPPWIKSRDPEMTPRQAKRITA